MQENIHPIYDKVVSRKEKEKLLRQRSVCIWLTGLSGSGKSTLASEVEKDLHQKGFLVKWLDGDNIRSGLNASLGFSEEDRIENIRRIAEVAKLFVEAGIIAICSFISPTDDLRKMACKIIGEKDYLEVYVNAPLSVCEARDVKGLYKNAREGKIKNFTGINAPFDKPNEPFLELRTDISDQEACKNILLASVLPRIIPILDH